MYALYDIIIYLHTHCQIGVYKTCSVWLALYVLYGYFFHMYAMYDIFISIHVWSLKIERMVCMTYIFSPYMYGLLTFIF